MDGRNNLVRSMRTKGQERIIVTVGVDDLCVIDTDDAVLVIPRERAQDVRLAVEELKQRGDYPDDLTAWIKANTGTDLKV